MCGRGVRDGDNVKLGTNRAKFDGNMATQREQEQFGPKVKWIF